MSPKGIGWYEPIWWSLTNNCHGEGPEGDTKNRADYKCVSSLGGRGMCLPVCESPDISQGVRKKNSVVKH